MRRLLLRRQRNRRRQVLVMQPAGHALPNARRQAAAVQQGRAQGAQARALRAIQQARAQNAGRRRRCQYSTFRRDGSLKELARARQCGVLADGFTLRVAVKAGVGCSG